jgi:SPOR domain
MADNTFRTTRRDAAARDAAAPGSQQFDDPLAELARLIGQTPPAGTAAERPAKHPVQQPVEHYEAPPLDALQQPDPQWAADARYAEPYDERQSQYDDRQGQYGDSQYADSQYADSQYADNQPGNSYDAARLADPPAPPYRAAPPSYNADYEQPDQYAAPPQQHDTRGYAEPPQYDDAHDPIQDVPAFLPRLRDEPAPERGQERAQAYAQSYGRDDGQNYSQEDYEQGYAQAQEGDPEDAYALEDYQGDDEAPAPKRRGFAIAAGIVGLIVLGSAGAFGYRTMFGGSMIPSLPPIIKADNTPNKIIPAGSGANASGQASAGKNGDKLVSREEKPVDVPAPASTPRVVSTIPVFPNPNAGLQSSVMPGGSPSMADQNMAGAVASGGPGAAGGPMSLGPMAAAPVFGTAAAPVAGTGPQNVPPLQSPPVAGAASAKKIHTVAIHNGQPDNSDTAAQAAPAASAHAPATRPMAPSRPVAAAPQGGNAPLSIVPSPGGAPANTAPPTRTALAHPAAQAAEAPPSSGGGGYLVQVSSQRSEAEAKDAFRGLQAKFPSQLGGHVPTIRQVNLGEKGTFYRTMVGPYGSMEQAAQMCSSLKAAGGSCIVQRN